MYSPPARTGERRSRVWWVLILAALMIGGYYYAQSEKEASETARQSFEQYLQVGDLTSAEQVLSALRREYAWVRDAKLRLAVAQDRVRVIEEAEDLIRQGKYNQAIPLLLEISQSMDTAKLLREARYGAAQAAIEEGNWREALGYLRDLPLDYQDTAQLKSVVADEVTRLAYEEGLVAMEEGDYASAERLFQEAKNAGGEPPADLDDQLAVATELRAQAEAKARIARIRENQNYYTYGDVGLAVGNAYFRSRIGLNYVAQRDHVFVVVYARSLSE